MKEISMTTGKLIISAFLGGFAYWLLDSAIDAYVFREGAFLSLAFSTARHESFMRLIIIALLAITSYVVLINRREKKTEEGLREKEKLLSESQRIAHIGGWSWDLRGPIDWTVETYRIYGVSPETFIPTVESLVNLLHPEDRPAMQRWLTACAAGEKPGDLEFRAISPDGAVRFLSGRGSLERDAENRPVRMVGTAQDITERKRIEAALRETTARLGAIMDSINALIYVADMKTHELLFMNKYGRDIWGESAGKTCWKTLQEGQSGPCAFCTNDRLIRQDGTPGEVFAWEFQNTVNNHWYDCRDQAIRWDDGRLVRMEIATDITERKKLEAQLRQAQKMEGLGTLAGGIAHDFNNILSAIIGYCNIAEMKLPEDHQVRLDLEQILEAAERAAILTQSLLTFSRKQPVKMELLKLNSVIGKFEKFLLRLLREDIELKTRYSAEELTILADRGQMEQVVMNLVTNARDAMPAHGVLTIETKPVTLDESFAAARGYGRAGEYVMLSVSDTGAGMDEETKRRIFEPFFTTKEVGKGTGLGLATVYGIVKTHDGFIDVYSEPERGTNFHIYLPLVHSTEKGKEPVRQASAPLKGGTETILLAEDDASLRKMTTTVLRHMGYTVIVAENGREAVDKFIANKDAIQLVILDGIMPRLSGKEAYREIAALVPGIRCIFMSGYAEDVFTKDGIMQFDVEFISKPVTPSVLLCKVRKVLER